MSPLTIFVFALLFTLLGAAWVVGCDFVKRHSPGHLVKFYMIMATIRCLFILTAAAIYILLISQSRAESRSFVIMLMCMYAVMMTVSLILKH